MSYNLPMNETTHEVTPTVEVLHKRVVMNEYRLTRDRLYSNVNCIGRDDLTARDGHYIVADCELEAKMKMAERYPDDGYNFTCQLWKKDVQFGF